MKRVLLVMAMMGFLFSAKAETDFELGLRFNPNLGWLVTQMEVHDDPISVENRGVRAGYSFGIDGTFNFADNYGIATEIRVNKLRGSFRYENDDDTAAYRDYTYDFRYIDVPISVKLRTNHIGHFVFFGRFGVTPGVNINQRGDIEYEVSEHNRENTDMSDDVNMIRIGGEIALGMHYNIAASTYLKASINYNPGLFNVINSNPRDETLKMLIDDHDLQIRNRYVGLNLGIIF